MRRGRILILLGLILACGTAAVIFLLLQNMNKQTPEKEVAREEVVIAAQPIEQGSAVDGRLEIKLMPVEALPPNPLRSLDGTTGMIAKGPIPQNTIVQADMLQTEQEMMAASMVGQLVEPGYVAVAFPITELSSVSYGIVADDRVDVLVSMSFIDLDSATQSKEPLCMPLCPSAGGGQQSAAAADQLPRGATQVTLQNVRVLGVGRWAYQPPAPKEGQQTGGDTQAGAAQEPPQFITLMLKPQEALVLKFAREQGAAIDLAVRQKDDTEAFVTEQVTLDYLMAHYGISLPAKKEYSIEYLPPK